MLAVCQVASELVGLLRLFGVLAHVSSLVLGLTVLAWGNSIPDLITDVAMARTGYCQLPVPLQVSCMPLLLAASRDSSFVTHT